MAQVIKIKRTNTPDNEPATLEEGELAVGMANTPPLLWVGTPTGVKQLVGDGIEDAPSDGRVYGRKNGDWAQSVGAIVSAVPPTNPVAGMLWWESTTGSLFLYFDDGNSRQWVQIQTQGPEGQRGPQGPPAAVIIAANPPANPVNGMVWWNSATGRTYIWYNDGDSAQWIEIGSGPVIGGGGEGTGLTISDTAPLVPNVGQLWWQSTTGRMFVWFDDGDSQQWVQVNDAGIALEARPGDWEFLAEVVPTASNSFALPSPFGTNWPTKYDEFALDLQNIRITATANLFFRVTVGGTSQAGANYTWNSFIVGQGGGAAGDDSTLSTNVAGTAMALCRTGAGLQVSAVASASYNGRIIFPNPVTQLGLGCHQTFRWDAQYWEAATYVRGMGAAVYAPLNLYDGFVFGVNPGAFVAGSGRVRLSGRVA